jgi:hypothetical protein
MQGDIVSPTIFNIVVDAVVRAWYHKLEIDGISDAVQAIFYANNGHLYSNNADALQRVTDLIVELAIRMYGTKDKPNQNKSNDMCAATIHHKNMHPCLQTQNGAG